MHIFCEKRTKSFFISDLLDVVKEISARTQPNKIGFILDRWSNKITLLHVHAYTKKNPFNAKEKKEKYLQKGVKHGFNE